MKLPSYWRFSHWRWDLEKTLSRGDSPRCEYAISARILETWWWGIDPAFGVMWSAVEWTDSRGATVEWSPYWEARCAVWRSHLLRETFVFAVRVVIVLCLMFRFGLQSECHQRHCAGTREMSWSLSHPSWSWNRTFWWKILLDEVRRKRRTDRSALVFFFKHSEARMNGK